MRKLVVFLLSVLLFVSLLGFALSASSNIAFTHPAKIKRWLSDSNLYGTFVANAIHEAQQTAGGDSSGISLNDAVVQQIAQSTFSAPMLQGDVNTFVDSNYAWLEGKQSTPNFRIDLTSAKQSFADRVSNYVETYLNKLPVCSATQLSELDPQNTDPLTLTCRPASVDPASVASQVSDEIASSGAFLSNPVITASTIDPKGDSQSQPYYQNLSGLPKVYQLGTKLPWITGVVTLASAIGVIFISRRHRKGLRCVSIALLLAGLVLVAIKFLSGQIFSKIQHHVFNNTDVGQLQKALTVFMHHIEDQLVKTNLWFGVAYLAVAVGTLVMLRATRQRSLMPSFLRDDESAVTLFEESQSTARLPASRNNPARPQRPPRRKPPRLIQ